MTAKEERRAERREKGKRREARHSESKHRSERNQGAPDGPTETNKKTDKNKKHASALKAASSRQIRGNARLYSTTQKQHNIKQNNPPLLSSSSCRQKNDVVTMHPSTQKGPQKTRQKNENKARSLKGSKLGGVLRATRLGATGLRGSEREICL